jgi:hypothetical protein
VALLLAAALLAPIPATRPRALPPGPVTITGVDAHDGTVYRDGDRYLLVGTMYGCGFHWGVNGTPWCGFAVYAAASINGPWTFVRLLFDPAGSDSWTGASWQTVCGEAGRGCFNPRMVRRPDGVWILWFNGPYDEVHHGANGYYAMGCNGPAGPCGRGAGPPYGTTNKPALWRCNNSGDFSVVVDADAAWIVCNTNGYSLATERLDQWWVHGTNVGVRGVAGLTGIEAPGAFRAADGTWIVTFSDPACGYCAGTATGYAVAPTLAGPWSWPANATSSGGDPAARRKISAHSCGGQPRTVTVLDGQLYQLIDLWHGGRNETSAGTRLEPLVPAPPYVPAPDGGLWRGGLRPFTCN